jgi:hypothetical protein
MGRPRVARLRWPRARPFARKIEDEHPGVGLFQCFLVMKDPTVGRFLIRDCDARLSAPEADLGAVNGSPRATCFM